jgi:hypothetical protein
VPTRLSHLIAGSVEGQPEIEKLIVGPVGLVVGETIDVGVSPVLVSAEGVPLFDGVGYRVKEQALKSTNAILQIRAPTQVYDKLQCKNRRRLASS